MSESLLHSILLLTALGVVAALVLYVVSKRFYVYEDPLIAEIEDLLLQQIVVVVAHRVAKPSLKSL